MANREKLQLSLRERRRRRFSENFCKEKVREIERGKISISALSRQYEVSHVSIYKWIAKFGTMKEKAVRLVVETESDTQELIKLKKKVAELERLVGQKQIQLEFKDKMIDLAEEVYGIDIKKKFTSPQSNTSGGTANNTDGV